MHVIGITGHIHVTPATTRLLGQALIDHLRRYSDPVHGVSCLAPGSDQAFVDALLEVGGTYEVVLPARDYRERMIKPWNRRRFDQLLSGATEVIHGEFDHCGPEAFAGANATLVSRCGELIAVWDGLADDRPGTTADAVGLARRSFVPVTHLWPAGAQRSSHEHAELVGSPTS
jgi:hypothetical protein